MKIRKITVTPVAFHDPALLNAVGVHEPYALRSVIQLHCDDGTQMGDWSNAIGLQREAEIAITICRCVQKRRET